MSTTDEPADFTAWWEGLADAPYFPGIERRIALHAWKSALAASPTAAASEPTAPVDAPKSYTYASEQATNCAKCGCYKHTPLRVDRMDGYVCLTCIDKELERLLEEEATAPVVARDALTAGLNMAIELCKYEFVDFETTGAFEDDLYNTAIRDCIRSIRDALARQAAAPKVEE